MWTNRLLSSNKWEKTRNTMNFSDCLRLLNATNDIENSANHTYLLATTATTRLLRSLDDAVKALAQKIFNEVTRAREGARRVNNDRSLRQSLSLANNSNCDESHEGQHQSHRIKNSINHSQGIVNGRLNLIDLRSTETTKNKSNAERNDQCADIVDSMNRQSGEDTGEGNYSDLTTTVFSGSNRKATTGMAMKSEDSQVTSRNRQNNTKCKKVRKRVSIGSCTDTSEYFGSKKAKDSLLVQLRAGYAANSTCYPSPALRVSLHKLLQRTTQRPTQICPGNGLFATTRILCGQVVGVYGDKNSDKESGRTKSGYEMGIDKGVIIGKIPDASDPWSKFGNINDYIWNKDKCNCKLLPGGIIVATRHIEEGEELYMSYGDYYDWSRVNYEKLILLT